MRLEDVTAVIRPRAPWESIDLGCVLAGKHIGLVWKAWCLTVLPLWILLGFVMRNHPVWFCVIVWWLKPIYARVPLLILSRALFGAAPTVWQVLKAWPKILVRRLFFALVVGRFSPARGLSMPVSELEGLRGAAYRQRVALLERNGGEGAVLATVVGLMLKLLVCATVVLSVTMMMPNHVMEEWVEGLGELWAYSDDAGMGLGFYWMGAVVWMLGIMLTEPFYAGAGFALYVNSRTLTEGWDIELGFKRMNARLRGLREGVKNSVALLVLGCLFCFGADQAVAAADRPVDEVLAHEDFQVHETTIEVDAPKEDSSSSAGGSSGFSDWLGGLFGSGGSLPEFFGLFGKVLFYVLLCLAVAGLVWLIIKNKHVFGGGGRYREKREPKATSVMGMDVTPESLPDDVADAARKAWRGGDSKLALSLLYRGSIAWCVNRAELPIVESDTEGDCVRHVKTVSDRSIVDYFGKLTQAWIGTAYGKQTPDDGLMVTLCDAWPFTSGKAGRVERREA